MDRRTTGQLRNLAYDAHAAGNYAEAANLYQLAIDRYPAGRGCLQDADIANLTAQAKQCRAGVPA